MKVGIYSKKILDTYDNNNYDFDLVRLDSFDDEVMSEIEIVVAGRLSNDQIDKAINLKHIFVPFTGKNGFDVDYVESKGIEIHTTSAHAKYVAERAHALALTLLGKITYFDSELRQNRWGNRNDISRISWNSISNKRIGLYGYGAIGKLLHSYVRPYTDNVTVYSRTLKDGVCNVKSLEELFDVSDIVFICVPLTKETEGSINESILKRNKDRMIVNIARGKVVDEDALYNALKDGYLSGFASDVWYQYPSKDNPVISPSKYDLTEFNVVMTPHCGGFADDSEELRYIDTLNNIKKMG